jgi:hypothetical protein
MAVTVITPIKLKLNEFVKETVATDYVAVDANDGAEFVMDARDEKYVIGVVNKISTSGNVTAIIKAGDGLQSAFGDTKIVIAKDEIAWVVIDSGRFKNITGDNKGKVIIKSLDNAGTSGSADLQVKVIQLP